MKFYKIRSKTPINGEYMYISLYADKRTGLTNSLIISLKPGSEDAGQRWLIPSLACSPGSTNISSAIDPKYGFNVYGSNINKLTCRIYKIGEDNTADAEFEISDYIDGTDLYCRIATTHTGNRGKTYFLTASGTKLVWKPASNNEETQIWKLEDYDISDSDLYIRSAGSGKFLTGEIFTFPEEGTGQKSRRLYLRSSYDPTRSRYWWRVGIINGFIKKIFSGKLDMSVIGKDVTAAEGGNACSSLILGDDDSAVELIEDEIRGIFKIKLKSENKYLTENGAYVCWSDRNDSNSQLWDLGIISFDASTTFGVDTAAVQDQNMCMQLHANGKMTLARYYDNAYELTETEKNRILNSGMSIVPLYQRGKTFSYSIGETHANGAISYALLIGQPRGTAIYFAVDAPYYASAMEDVTEYFRGIYEYFKACDYPYKIGVYGCGDVCYVLNGKYDKDSIKWVDYFMLAGSTGWPDSFNFAGNPENYHIRQSDQIKYNNVNYDLNIYNNYDYGQWL